jgi:superfamily II DNA/RNA helicase
VLKGAMQNSDFLSLGLATEIVRVMAEQGFSQPTAIQTQAIPAILAGADLIAVAQTGTGKTLAYLLPTLTLLLKTPQARAVILTPSRETAEQVHRVVSGLIEVGQKFAPSLQFKLGLVTPGITTAILSNQLKKNPRLIVATPGRLCDQLTGNKLLLQGTTVLVIDEADRILDQGFEPQLKFIQSTLRGTRQTLLFAASFGNWAEPIAQLLLRPEHQVIRAEDAERPVATLLQKVFFLTSAQKQNRLLDELKSVHGGVIVFADSQENCVALGRLLQNHGFSSEFVHGDMNPGHRNRVLREFREEKIQILVTSDLLARGLDIPHVKHILNFDLPYKSEDFLHRIGRTARAGKEGRAVTFITPADGRTYRKIKKYLQGASEETLARDFQFIERD